MTTTIAVSSTRELPPTCHHKMIYCPPDLAMAVAVDEYRPERRQGVDFIWSSLRISYQAVRRGSRRIPSSFPTFGRCETLGDTDRSGNRSSINNRQCESKNNLFDHLVRSVHLPIHLMDHSVVILTPFGLLVVAFGRLGRPEQHASLRLEGDGIWSGYVDPAHFKKIIFSWLLVWPKRQFLWSAWCFYVLFCRSRLYQSKTISALSEQDHQWI
jgi:hypothetical protein